MAITRTNFCPECKTDVREMRPNDDYDPVCSKCRKKKADTKRNEWLTNRAAMPIEERLRLIEEYIYDYKPPVDIMNVRF